MTTVELLSHLRRLDVRVWTEGDRLRISAPQNTLTAALREELTRRKTEILDFFREAGPSSTSPPPLRRASRDSRLPLSFTQQRLWFLDQLVPGSPLYNIKTAYRLRGALDEKAVREALNAVVARHESLRTRFVLRKDEPEQVIDDPTSVDLRMVDLSGHVPADREHTLSQVLRAEARRPYDLAEDLMLRAMLVRLDKEEHVLFIGLHHIAADGWSLSILIREFSTFYAAATKGSRACLPELPIQYADYAVWQHEWLRGAVLEEQLVYWRKRLSGVSQLELPTDQPRTTAQSRRSGHYRFVLPAESTSQLKRLAQQEHATLFVVLLAAFNVILHRYTGQTDLIIGCPVANRDRSELEPLIGMFVRTLVVRTDLSDNPTFRELVRRVQAEALEGLSRPDVPLEELDVWSGAAPRIGSLVRALFAFQNIPKTALNLPMLQVERMTRLSTGMAKFDLSLVMRERQLGLTGGFDYYADLFDRATIERLTGHFCILLSAAAVDPDRPVGLLPLTTEPERERVIKEWNSTPEPICESPPVHEQFEAQATRTPEAIAVVNGVKRVTYRELDARADHLARDLRKLGVGPEMLVGLFVDRSVEMVVAILGILKAGGAYLPLDPDYPFARLSLMLADAAPPVLVTQAHLATRLPEIPAHIIRVDGDESAAPAYTGPCSETEEPASRVASNNLAYVIYTSGSTGTPKGVTVEHRALANFTRAARAAYALGPGDSVLQFASVSFDAAAEEIFPCLTCGGTLVLRTERMLDSAPTFLRACDEQRVTVLDLPTSFWHEVTDTLAAEAHPLPETVRLVIIGGERARPEPLERWRRWVKGKVRLVNTYGPTEATVVATMFEVTGTATQGEVPIGRPIAHVQAYVLDPHLNPAPVGVPGELYIGGSGVARGYLNRPALTAERFIPDPFGGEPGARLYRTGDLARWLPDGELVYVGRADAQVKLRGYRVELGEVEAMLQEHAAVATCAVALPKGDDTQLVAYVVSQQTVSDNALRAYLQERLPAHMIPSAWVRLDKLPLLPSGKVDRKLLPEPDPTSGRHGYEPPRTEVEQALAAIWMEVLGAERVGLHDNFFDMGGHSLLAMRVISRVRAVFAIDLPVRCLFESDTLSAFVGAVTKLNDQKDDRSVTPTITRLGREERRMRRSSLWQGPK